MPELIAARGWTRTEFARRLGVSDALVSQVIARKCYFSYPVALKAAKLLGCAMEELHEIDDEEGTR